MMRHYVSISFLLLALLADGTLPAATKPQAGRASDSTTWTSEDLERLKNAPDLISVVGQPAIEGQQSVDAPSSQPEIKDPAWYAAQASILNTRLESEQAELRDFEQKLENAQELGTTTPGVNLDEADPGITPEATIESLRDRVRATQSELDSLEDLARRNDMAPGILRGQ